MPELRLRNVVKDFGSTRAVNGIDLTVGDAQLLSLLGPSGCGKTTTLRMVAGLEQVTDGEIFVGDDLVSSGSVFVPPERRSIGMVFQSYAVWPHMTVFDNVAYPLQVRRKSRAEIHKHTMETLELVELAAYAKRNATQLSGGQQQRVALARAIVFEPRILLLDEPLSNLDEKLRESMRTSIRSLQQRIGITSLYVTHDQREALAVSDIVAVMSHGQIVQVGKPRDIYEIPRTRFVAEFAGWANFLPADVVDASSVRLTGSPLIFECTVEPELNGENLSLAIRPEGVQVTPGFVDLPNSIQGEVLSVVYQGEHLACRVRTDLHQDAMTVRLISRDTSIGSGDRVTLSFPVDRLRLVVE